MAYPNKGRYLGRWTFDVYDQGGFPKVFWSVHDESDVETRKYTGRTTGPLHLAVIDAYHEVGLICPLIVEPDLARMGGHGEEDA